MKKSLILISIMLINFVSAYNNFSLDNAFRNIDETTFILGALFVLIFGITSLILKKRFTDESEQMTSGIIALAFSALVVYWIYTKDFGIADFFEDIFSSIGINSDILYLILPLIILAGIIYLIYKMKEWGLLIIGILLLILALISGNLILGIIGAICLITGIILIKKGEGGKLFGKLILLLIVFCFGYFAPFYTGIVVILYLIFRLLKNRDNRESIKTGLGSTYDYGKNKLNKRKINKAHGEALKENEFRKHEAYKSQIKKAQKEEKRAAEIEAYKEKKEREEAQRIAKINAQKQIKAQEKQQRIAEIKAERERIRQERKENNETIRQREKGKKEIVKKIRSLQKQRDNTIKNFEKKMKKNPMAQKKRSNQRKLRDAQNTISTLDRKITELRNYYVNQFREEFRG